jgi:hypothetical protein
MSGYILEYGKSRYEFTPMYQEIGIKEVKEAHVLISQYKYHDVLKWQGIIEGDSFTFIDARHLYKQLLSNGYKLLTNVEWF